MLQSQNSPFTNILTHTHTHIKAISYTRGTYWEELAEVSVIVALLINAHSLSFLTLYQTPTSHASFMRSVQRSSAAPGPSNLQAKGAPPPLPPIALCEVCSLLPVCKP